MLQSYDNQITNKSTYPWGLTNRELVNFHVGITFEIMHTSFWKYFCLLLYRYHKTRSTRNKL